MAPGVLFVDMIFHCTDFCFVIGSKIRRLKVLLIDNYDSFTYNLVHYLEGFDCEVTVWFNDQADLDLINTFDKIVLGPGPDYLKLLVYRGST